MIGLKTDTSRQFKETLKTNPFLGARTIISQFGVKIHKY